MDVGLMVGMQKQDMRRPRMVRGIEIITEKQKIIL